MAGTSPAMTGYRHQAASRLSREPPARNPARHPEPRIRRLAILALVVPLATPSLAAFPCDEFWGELNAVYAEAGYGFRTARGIAAFGNAHCRYDDIRDVPLSARDRQKVREIVRQERENGCRE